MTQRHGFGDPRISWTVLLTATLDRVPSDLGDRLAALAERNAWTEPYPLSVTISGHDLTLAADHRQLDGQAMLAALASLIDAPVRSLARGVDETRPSSGLGLAGLQRMAEAILRPSAVVPKTVRNPSEEDALAHLRLPRRVSTSDLVVAATRAIGSQVRGPISVAVGVAGQTDPERLADRSGYLRIRDARGLSRPEVSAILKTAPLQPSGGAPTRAAAAAALVTRLLANRLGSTILVSHLGDIEADAITDLAFYPVSGGASGLSLGAATLHGHTTVTLRARGSRHDADGLQRLLEAIGRLLEE